MKLKWSILLNPLGNIIQENYGSFYPSGLFTLDHFTMRHPVTPNNLNPHSLVCTKSSFLKKEGVKMHCSKKKTVSLCINIIIPPFLFLSTILQAGCPDPLFVNGKTGDNTNLGCTTYSQFYPLKLDMKYTNIYS